jgi:hypothetical protein
LAANKANKIPCTISIDGPRLPIQECSLKQGLWIDGLSDDGHTVPLLS